MTEEEENALALLHQWDELDAAMLRVIRAMPPAPIAALNRMDKERQIMGAMVRTGILRFTRAGGSHELQ